MNIIIIQGLKEKKARFYYEYDADSIPLGEGGMGRVFKGFRVDEVTGERRPVAIKAIYDNIPERVVERARREAEIQLEHENLIRMYGFVETIVPGEALQRPQKHYHVIMELLVGVTLEDVINGITSNSQGIPIPFAAELYTQYTYNREMAVIRIMKAILSGLMTMHDKGYIHRDIDPSNIMITADNKIKLIDFGICKQIISLESQDKALTASGVFMGKVNYAAPELVLGDVRNQNATTDIYALGILLYQLYMGRLPFNGTDQDILAANLRRKIPMKGVKDKDFRRIILKSTEKIQAKRYGTVAEFRVDLEKVESSYTDRANNGLNNSYKWVGLIAASLLIGFFGWYIISHKDIDKPTESERVLSVEELYSDAINLLAQTDSIALQTKGKEIMKVLAVDSLYKPAMINYNTMLLNSSVPNEMKIGYSGLLKLAEEGVHIAMQECGVTLSKYNSSFAEPLIRQKQLGIEADMEKANEWLEKSMMADTTDYKSVYWTLNNLIEQNAGKTLSSKDAKRLSELYKMFEKRVANYDDSVANEYKKAIEIDKETLWAWNIL